jgi:hypothetical protein
MSCSALLLFYPSPSPPAAATIPRGGSSGRSGRATALRHIVISTHVMDSPARRLTNPITRCWKHPITAMQGQTTAEAPTKDLTLNDLR